MIRCAWLCILVLITAVRLVAADDRPNILWITSEDNGCELGCYGDAYSTTPNLDKLAAKSMRFNNVWSNAPVCAPARTAIVTGMWPPSIGASHMRSEVELPKEFKLFPALLKQAGYYCTNNNKEDYNVVKEGSVWDESSKKAHWRNRPAGKPFFAVFNSTTSHESQLRKRPHKAVHDASKVVVPGYHPDLPEIRQDWAQYYDKLSEMDAEQGDVLQQLEQDGLTDSTIIFYFGDHGSGMPRGKRWLYQSGLRVPLLISVPERFRDLADKNYIHGGTTDRLTSFIDLAPTVLSLCGVDIPEHFDGHAILGPQQKDAPSYLYGFRDRMDERYDCSRAIRDENFLYIKNFMPHRPQGQYLGYMYETPTTVAWLTAAKSGKTTEAQSLFWRLKPSEELYDLKKDPQQLNNLAGQSQYAEQKDALKTALKNWLTEQRDLGLVPECVMKDAVDQSSDPHATPWSIGLISETYPFDDICQAAFLATDERSSLQDVTALANSPNEVIRYWAVIGLMNRGLTGRDASMPELVKMANTDSSLAVRCIANEALGRLQGEAAPQQAAKNLLAIIADPRNSPYVGMLAFDSMVALNLSETSLPAGYEAYNRKLTNVPTRYDGYWQRGVEDLQRLSTSPELHTPIK